MISSSLKSSLLLAWQTWKLPLANYILQGLIVFGLGLFSYSQLFALFSTVHINPDALRTHPFGLYTDLVRLVDMKVVMKLLLDFGLITFVYQILTVFTAGGNMDAVLEKQYRTQRFFIQSRRYFLPSCKLAIIKLLCNAVMLLVLLLCIYTVVNKLTSHSETIIALSILPAILLFSLTNFLFTNSFWLSIKQIIQFQSSPWHTFFRFVVLQVRSPSFLSATGLTLLIGFILSIVVFHCLPLFTPNLGWIFVSFFLQQFAIFTQFFIRCWRLHLIAKLSIFT